MSSDVYVDFGQDPEAHESDTVRIGHLGQLCYFGRNAIDFLELLQLAEPILNDHLVRTIGSVLDRMVENWATVRQDPEYSQSLYGYVVNPREEADIMPGVDFVSVMHAASGSRWRVRVD